MLKQKRIELLASKKSKKQLLWLQVKIKMTRAAKERRTRAAKERRTRAAKERSCADCRMILKNGAETLISVEASQIVLRSQSNSMKNLTRLSLKGCKSFHG